MVCLVFCQAQQFARSQRVHRTIPARRLPFHPDYGAIRSARKGCAEPRWCSHDRAGHSSAGAGSVRSGQDPTALRLRHNRGSRVAILQESSRRAWAVLPGHSPGPGFGPRRTPPMDSVYAGTRRSAGKSRRRIRACGFVLPYAQRRRRNSGAPRQAFQFRFQLYRGEHQGARVPP